MEDRSYIERRNEIKRAGKMLHKKRGGYFIFKLNLVLAAGIMLLCANMMDLDIADTFGKRLENTIDNDPVLSDAKDKVISAVNKMSGGSIFVLAKESHPVTMDEELIAEMESKASAYREAQKKTLKQ